MRRCFGGPMTDLVVPSLSRSRPLPWRHIPSPGKTGYDPALTQSPPEVDRMGPESTLDLLARMKAGDRQALEQIFERCLPPLRRWARGRLPRYARDLLETEDLVQETVLHAL